MPSALLHFTFWGWAIAGCGALFIGLAKGGLTGVGIVPVLLFAMVLPARESTGFVLPLLLVGDLGAVGAYWRSVDWGVLFRLLPPTLIGVAVGYLCMGHIDPAHFAPLIGAIILGLILLQFLRQILGERIDHFFHSPAFSLPMGGLAGVTTMIANAAGPVTNLYFLSIRLPKLPLIATTAWLYFFTNLWKVPFSIHLGLINPGSVALGLYLAPVVVLGLLAGRKLATLIPQKQFNLLVLLLSALGALRLIFS